ncbi:MAG: ATP-binding cassette domain-containing protein [Chloroflexota bacterium]|nr:ATP-binding cassette domain-containing protein [Chloroflexota bacterium]
MIEVREIDFRYPGEMGDALIDVSLSVAAREVVGIVGPNGSGKSTLARLMKGLLVPTRGTVLVDGFDTRRAGLDVRRVVGLLFQNPNSQIVNAVIEQEVAFGPENLGLPPAEIRRRVEGALRSVGLENRELAECHGLSMADKQRVALAAVMAMEPRYLILDEPTAWLEPAARWALLGEVLGWAKERGAGVVIVTHRMDEAALSDRLYGMLHGRIEVEGTPEDILRDVQARAALSLELPETYTLAGELREAGLPVVPGTGVGGLAEALCPS